MSSSKEPPTGLCPAIPARVFPVNIPTRSKMLLITCRNGSTPGSIGRPMATAKEHSSPALEAPLEPGLVICDPHHHLWDRPHDRYFLEDLIRDMSSHNVAATVAVECRAMYRKEGPVEMKPIGESEFLDGVAARASSNQNITTRVAAGIVGHADLRLGDSVAPVLEAHVAASPDRLRGIRHSTTWDASEKIRSDAPAGLLADSSFRRGFACLRRYGLSFDAWLYHPQLLELADLARSFPDVTIILDHIGGPLGVGPYAGKRAEVLRQWQSAIVELAKCPNVMVK